MELKEVTSKEFSQIISTQYHAYGSVSFANLNIAKADKIFYLLFKNSKYRLGLIGGLKNNTFYTPFSAPFGGFIFLHDDIKLNFIDDAVRALTEWAINKNFEYISFTLPPNIYHESFIAKQINSLFREEYLIKKIDLNHSIDLNKFDPYYIKNIWYNARKNLKNAFSKELYFKKCKTIIENKLAYEVIKRNRISKGFPIHMTWENVEMTTSIILADFFLIYNSTHEAIASAINFHISSGIVQVIFWGDLPEFSILKPMNYLSYKIFEYYKNMGIKIVDIGPSTENSIPNFGLCDFKESIGCDTTTKLTFSLHLK